MNPEILTRLLIAISLVGLGAACYAMLNYVALRRARSRRLGLERIEQGRPVLVYFTTPTCAPCKTVQRPAIRRLSDLMGDCLQVVEIDASTQPEIARLWNVMTVPTTYILDNKGQPRYVNHGVTLYDELVRQMANLCPGA
jgi:thioredoxin 1